MSIKPRIALRIALKSKLRIQNVVENTIRDVKIRILNSMHSEN